MKNSSAYDKLYKILLLGDSMVGKTSFLVQYTENKFTENPISTVGLDYKIKSVKLHNDKVINLQIWDTAGQDKFRSITQNYYKGAHAIILMYDITSIRTFTNIRNWISSIRNSSDENIKILLIGNKIDLEEFREVKKVDGEKMANEFNLSFFEVSAKKNINLEDSIAKICKIIYDAFESNNHLENRRGRKFFTITRNKTNNNHDSYNKGCCK